MAALFHDAAEAYLGDVVAPLKYGLPAGARTSVYDLLADTMDEAIADRYGVSLDAVHSDHLRLADLWARRIEAHALTHTGGEHWRWPASCPTAARSPAPSRGWAATSRRWPASSGSPPSAATGSRMTVPQPQRTRKKRTLRHARRALRQHQPIGRLTTMTTMTTTTTTQQEPSLMPNPDPATPPPARRTRRSRNWPAPPAGRRDCRAWSG